MFEVSGSEIGGFLKLGILNLILSWVVPQTFCTVFPDQYLQNILSFSTAVITHLIIISNSSLLMAGHFFIINLDSTSWRWLGFNGPSSTQHWKICTPPPDCMSPWRLSRDLLVAMTPILLWLFISVLMRSLKTTKKIKSFDCNSETN